MWALKTWFSKYWIVNSQAIDQYSESVSDVQSRQKRLKTPRSTENREMIHAQNGIPMSSLLANKDNEGEGEDFIMWVLKVLDVNSQAIDQCSEIISDLQSRQKRLEDPRSTKNRKTTFATPVSSLMENEDNGSEGEDLLCEH